LHNIKYHRIGFAWALSELYQNSTNIVQSLELIEKTRNLEMNQKYESDLSLNNFSDIFIEFQKQWRDKINPGDIIVVSVYIVGKRDQDSHLLLNYNITLSSKIEIELIESSIPNFYPHLDDLQKSEANSDKNRQFADDKLFPSSHPLKQLDHVDHLIIVPHGELMNIPWEVLEISKKGDYNSLSDLVPVTRGLSITSYLGGLKGLNPSRFDTIKRALLFGNLNHGIELQESEKEIKYARKIIEPHFSSIQLLTDSKAPKETILSILTKDQHSLVHFAGHIEFPQGITSSPEFAFEHKMLTSNQTELSVRDLLTSSIQFTSPSFGILSACNAGNTNVVSNLESISLPYSFLSKGMTSIISTLYGVDDKMAKKIVSLFYNEWLMMDSASALQSTRKLIRQIYDWGVYHLDISAFFHVGPPIKFKWWFN